MKRIILMVCFLGTLSACKKETMECANNPDKQHSFLQESLTLNAIAEQEITSMEKHRGRNALQFYRGSLNDKIVESPGFNYLWAIDDGGSLTQAPQVRIFGPDRVTYYINLIRHSNGRIWYWYGPLSLPGHWAWRYLYTDNNNSAIALPWNSYVDNTRVRIDPHSTSHLVWPFGHEDQSSWNSPGLWTMGCGHGCNAHTGNFYYSQDWNWNTSFPFSDNGKILASPVDGIVENISTYQVTINNSVRTAYQIIIKQMYGDSYVRFMYGHIQSDTFVQQGDYVRSGEPIARLGSTGATSPHAHCMLLKSNGQSTPFLFNQ